MKLHDKMNEYLANQHVMYMKLHNLHWYLKGPGFFTLHVKLEELYNATALIVDGVAERLLQLDAMPVASMEAALKMTSVKELDDQPIDSAEAMDKLLTDVEYWINDTKEVIDMADKADDPVTADLFTGYLAEYQKLRWMVKSYLDA